MKHFLKRYANISSPILITGPTGTGKSKLAQDLFAAATINREKFLTLHLASVKEELIESELFGHVKGAFTGAFENKLGYFREVGHGTLFLDEIGELSHEAQKKLLYLLEEKKFTPVGSTTAFDFKGRIMLATNKNLKELVRAGKFREDLYYRLNIFPIELLPISLDKEVLCSKIFEIFQQMKERFNKKELQISEQVKSLLLQALWKGNFRELKNCCEYMVVMSEGTLVQKEHLPIWFIEEISLKNAVGEKEFLASFPEDYNLAVERFEAWYLEEKLKKFGGRVNQTSRQLGISKTALIYKAKKYKISTIHLRADASAEKLGIWVA